jgi:uncharacterized repeat protein (TIGR01451 family)
MKKKTFAFASAIVIFLIISSNILAEVSNVIITSMVPPNPNAGDLVTVNFTYCKTSDLYNNDHFIAAVSPVSTFVNGQLGQTFKVNESGIDVGGVGDGSTTAAGGYNMGDGDGVSTCPYTTSFTFHIPNTLSGGTYYVIIGGKKDYVDLGGAYPASQNYISFNVPLPPPAATITKSAESSIAMPGDTVLYTINYNYVNATNFTVTDNVPANVTFLQASLGGALVGSTITWNTASVAGPTKIGSFWYTAIVNTGLSGGTVIDNTANWVMNEIPGGGSSNDATVTIGQPFTITKSENVATAAIGDTITYTFSIQNSGGMAFCGLDNFDTNIAGYHDRGNGTWSWLSDGAGSGYIYSPKQSGSTTGYPHYLRNSPTNFCFGTIQADIETINTDGAGGKDDGLIVFRDDNIANGCSYGIGISQDGPDGNGAHSLWLQRYCGAVGSAIAFGSPAPTISDGIWYTVKIQVTDPGNGIKVEAKAWPRSTAEPVGWQLTWTDTTAGWPACGYVGVQGHPSNANYYDNVKIVKSTMSYPTLFDTLPTELTYLGGTGADATHSNPVNNGQVASWNIFTTFPQNVYTLELYSIVNYCGTLLNKASLGTVESAPIDSNTVSLNVPVCPETATFTPTYTVTDTYTLTATLTPTLTYTLTPTLTSTLTETPSPIIPQFNLTKAVAPSTVNIGDTVTYTVSYFNTGLIDLTNLDVWDTVPAQLNNITTISPAGGNYSVATGVVSWVIADVPVGGSGDLIFTGVVSNNVNNGQVMPNTAYGTVTSGQATVNSNTVNLTASVPELQLTPIMNYPNPFGGGPTDSTTIVFGLTVQAEVNVKFFTLSGELVKTMTYDELKSKLVAPQSDTQKGTNKFTWDGTNNSNAKLSSGIYFYRVEAKRGNETRHYISKLAILR